MNQAHHILVVDDDDDITALLCDYLASFGFVAHAAADGVAMRRQLDQHAIDLIVLDLQLPGTDGLSLANELRRKSRIPIVMLTARGNPIDRVIGLEMGADDYMSKPFEPRELVARIHTVLRRVRGGTEASAAGAATGAAAGAGAGAAAAGAGAGAGAAAAAPSASSISTTEPCLTLSPRATLSSFTTPAVLDGISIEALSDSTVISDCSALTVSPTLTSSSMTATSSKSPMSGTFTSTSAMFLSPEIYAYSGLTLSAWMPYLAMASATLATGTAPSSLKALRAATTM